MWACMRACASMCGGIATPPTAPICTPARGGATAAPLSKSIIAAFVASSTTMGKCNRVAFGVSVACRAIGHEDALSCAKRR